MVYVTDRLPLGIEECRFIVLAAEEELAFTNFPKIVPLKRPINSYRVDDETMYFEITKGRSEVYDILTHLTFLNIESRKIKNKVFDESGNRTRQWRKLEDIVTQKKDIDTNALDQSILNLSDILGRTFRDTKKAYERLQENKKRGYNNGLFNIIYWLGRIASEENTSKENEIQITFTNPLREIIGTHKHAEKWATSVKGALYNLGLQNRPIHIISSNMHSVVNLIYGYLVQGEADIFEMAKKLRGLEEEVRKQASQFGMSYLQDDSGTHINYQIIDTTHLETIKLHPKFTYDIRYMKTKKPVLVVMDYAFGEEAFQVMDELLKPYESGNEKINFNIESISIMGKAGTLTGQKGDIMIPNSFVFEGTPYTYILNNELTRKDFNEKIRVDNGPMVTVLGTSLQNNDILEYFSDSSWNAVGIEMEGGHYQRAIQSAIIRRHIPADIVIRYAYYASDNPLKLGHTLASGGLGEEGIIPTYTITKVILEKILNPTTRGSRI